MRLWTQTEILPTHTPPLFDAAVERAARLLQAGEVVALPTETVYGLAANAFDANAVARIYEIKGRPAHNPIIVHVAEMELARRCVSTWPVTAQKLAAAFWPGPLTLVLPRANELPEIVTAGGETVGIRWPSHPLIQAVIRRCGFPLAAPSANLANQISPTNAGHVQQALDKRIPLIVDGGQAQVGIESTVLDLTCTPLQVLRPGMIHAESLLAVLGDAFSPVATRMPQPATSSGQPLRSPGQLERHYSPRAHLMVLSWRDEADLRKQIDARKLTPGECHVLSHGATPTGGGWAGVSVIPHDAEAYARAFYAELHRCDAEGARWIVVEALPEGTEWQAIADRLQRAAAG